MGKHYVLTAVSLASVLLFLQVEAMQYTCTLDNSTTYEYPDACYWRTSSSDNNTASNTSAVPNSGDDLSGEYLSGYDKELDEMELSPTSPPNPPNPPKPRPGPPKPHPCPSPPSPCNITKNGAELLKCCWKFEYVRILFLASICGQRLQDIDSSLMMNGTCEGAQRAYISQEMQATVEQMLYASIDQMKTLKLSIGSSDSVEGINVNFGRSRFAGFFDKAFGLPLYPRFDCYRDDIHVMLALYWFNALTTKCYIGILDKMESAKGARLAGSLAATKASQETLIRSKMFDIMDVPVRPYYLTIAEFTEKMSTYSDRVMNTTGCSDKGLEVPACLSIGGQQKNMFSLDDKGLPFGMAVNSTCEVVDSALSDFMY